MLGTRLLDNFLGFLASLFKSFKDSRLPKTAFPVFKKILIQYSGSLRNFKTDLHDMSVPVFSKTFKMCAFRFQFYKNTIREIVFFGGIIAGLRGSPKKNNIGVGAQGHVQKSRDHRNERGWVSPISKSKS